MKRFFKRIWDFIIFVSMIYTIGYIIYLASSDQWIKLAKFSFFLGLGVMSAIFEIPEMLSWQFKKIFKSKE